MSDVWKRIRAWERKHLPRLPEKARGASAAAQRRARERFPLLPQDFLDRMAERNGTDSPIFYPWVIGGLGEMVAQWGNLQAWHGVCGDDGIQAKGPVRPVYLSSRWIPFAYDIGGNHLCLDLDPAEGGEVGQVV